MPASQDIPTAFRLSDGIIFALPEMTDALGTRFLSVEWGYEGISRDCGGVGRREESHEDVGRRLARGVCGGAMWQRCNVGYRNVCSEGREGHWVKKGRGACSSFSLTQGGTG